MLFTLLLVSLRAALVLCVASSNLTYTEIDPVTGRSLQCDGCPPGTYLRARCRDTRGSDCAPCPEGSFTELWNYIGKCLRCSVCGYMLVEKKACSADSDCQCACKPGYYFKKTFDMCVRHSKCPAGHEVRIQGTPDEDTVCHVCPNGTYSDVVSDHANCTEHKSCSAPGLQLLLKGSVWHNSVCVNCEEHRSKDGANYLREILPAFFAKENIAIRRLNRMMRRLQSVDGKRREVVSGIDFSDRYDRINKWISTTTEKQILRLPEQLNRVGAINHSKRLQLKLHKINAQLKELCGRRNEVVEMVESGWMQ